MKEFHLNHFFNIIFIIISFIMASSTALKKFIIPLYIKKSFFIEAIFLKLVINISCNYKIIFSLN